MRSNIFKRALSLTLCGTMLFTTPTINVYADELAGEVSEVSIYMTTTPKVMVGDTALICLSGGYDFSAGKRIQWYRSATKDTSDGVAIEGATGVWYTYTENDIGYYVYGTISYTNESNKTVVLVTNFADKAVSNRVEEVENWIVSSDSRWCYDILDGTNNIQIKATKAAGDRVHGLVGDITIPSSLDGYKVTKLADNCFQEACTHSTGSGSSLLCYINSIKFPSTLEEIGSNLNLFNDDSKNIVLPESVKYIKGNPFTDFKIYAYNGDDGSTTRSVSKVTVKNPVCHFDVIPATATSVSKGRVTYAGAIGGSLWNVYQEELNHWMSAGELPSAKEKYYWQTQGIYNAASQSLTLSDKDKLQQAIDENIKDWKESSDGKFQIDDIDGTDKVVVKPIEVNQNELIEVPGTIDGKEVGAVELGSQTNKWMPIIDVPKDVIIDRENTSLDDSAIISGNEGSDAEEYAKENDLVFQNKDKQLTTYEEYNQAKKSEYRTSEDGYWSYQFIDGYNGVVIKNIKSFGSGAVVEVPDTIDGFKVTAFNGAGVETQYNSISLPESVTVVTEPTLFHGASHGGAYWTTIITKNLTVYNKEADLSVINNNDYYNATITGWTGSTADNHCINRLDGSTNENGVVKSIFIPLDDKPTLSEVSISGLAQEGKELTATVKPTIANNIDYTWLVSDDNINFSKVENSNATKFTIPEGYAGKYLKVRATGKENFTGSVESDTIQIASKDAIRISYLDIKDINYSKNIGSELSTTISPNGATATYQWYRDVNVNYNYYDTTSSSYSLSETAEKIEGATESTYTVTAADADKYLFVVATGTGNYFGGYQTRTTARVSSNIGTVSIENYNSTKYVGDTLAAKLSNTANEGKVKYQWYKNTSQSYSGSSIPSSAEKIEGATDSTYTLSVDDIGKYIFVVIEGIVEEGVGGTAVSNSTYNIRGKVTGVSITGQPYIGQTLEAVSEPEEATVTYQWFRSNNGTSNSNNITGATNNTYTLTNEDKDYYIGVEVTGTNIYSGNATAFTSEKVTNIKDCEEVGLTHQPSSWILIKDATCTETGLEVKTCEVCGKTLDTSDISATGHHYENVNGENICTNVNHNEPDNTNDTVYPWTKDVSGIWKSNIERNGGASTSLVFNFSLSEETNISFDWFCNAEGSNYDYLTYELKKDGVSLGTEKFNTDRNNSYSNTEYSALPFVTVNKTLQTGDYELMFTYKKDSSGDIGLDSGFIRNINVPIMCGDKEPVKIGLGDISITGETTVGETLTVSVEPSDATVSYDWYVGDSADAIEWTKIGSIGDTYTLSNEFINRYIKVVVTGTGDYEGTKEVISNKIVGLDFQATVKENPTVGETIRVNFTPSNMSRELVWYRGDSEEGPWTRIDESWTMNEYTISESDVDKVIKIEIFGLQDYAGTKKYLYVRPVKSMVLHVTVSGDTTVGETLTANIEPSEATVNIEWYRGDYKEGAYTWTKIEGADKETYTLTEEDTGKFIKVLVEGTGEYHGIHEDRTDETVKAAIVETDKISKVSILGDVTVGETVTAQVYPSTINADIRWLIADTIDGEYREVGIGSNYTITENDLDKYIKVEATNTEDISDVILSVASKVYNKDEETETGGKIKDSVEKVEYIQEDMTETAFDSEEQRDVLVYASQGQSFSVRIPKRIVFDGSSSTASVDFETEITADISGNDTIIVCPEAKSLEMEESAGIKRPLICNLELGQTSFSILNDSQEALEEGKVANHTATISNLTAGSWKGTFNWIITAKGKEIEDSTN